MPATPQIGENIALDEIIKASEVLSTFDEIEHIEEVDESTILVTILKKQFLFLIPDANERDSAVYVLLYNDDGLDFPHIMLKDFKGFSSWPPGGYRWVCLYDGIDIVYSIMSYSEKIIDATNRLIELLTWTEAEKEREFQKEFLFYWNNCSSSTPICYIFLRNPDHFSRMDIFYGRGSARIIEPEISLSDLENRDDKDARIWVRHVEEDIYYIPLTDLREILPPHRGYEWTPTEIKNIIYAPQIEHISKDSLEEIKATIPKTQNIILVFGLEQYGITFSIRLICSFEKSHSLFEKILFDCTSVEPLRTYRKDYQYMNLQIGNDPKLQDKQILLIGAGSLGSYVGFELVKNGASKIKIYDEDKLEDANILRWAFCGIGRYDYKTTNLSFFLNSLHPEVQAEGINKNITVDTLRDEASKADLIIFTIGNSDQQLKFNRVLKEMNCSVPTIFTWLEAGGNYSHLLLINYQNAGCFECLYTDSNGNSINNRSTIESLNIEESMIRNGCGGTRAAYGTATILRTTSALLNLIKDTFGNDIHHNILIDITPDSVRISNTKFPEEACSCCGNK